LINEIFKRKYKEVEMMRKYVLLIGSILALSIISGCAQTMLDKNWGKSFESAKSNQIANPEAEKNLNPVVGLDGEAAETNMEKYRESFKERARENIYNLRLGNIAGIGED